MNPPNTNPPRPSRRVDALGPGRVVPARPVAELPGMIGALVGAKTSAAPAPPVPVVAAVPLGRQRWWRRIPRRYAIAGAAVLVVLVGGGVSYAVMSAHTPKPVSKPKSVAQVKPPAPAPIYDPLTGLAVADSAAAQQPVIGVMIENLYPNARPQSGLGQAGVVYEALAEGGITRFLAIFQQPLPATLGPVRSLRPYYLDWGLEYGIPVAHAGGSQPALAEVPTSGLKDINALMYDGSYFFRTADRAAPHNLYTNSQLLAQLDTKLGFAAAPAFTPEPRKVDKAESPPTHPTIKLTFSSTYYNVEYDFVAATDSYNRFMGGTPHIDRNTGQQIQVKNIVVEMIPTSYGTQDDGKPETDYSLTGQGQALVFEDGGVTVGTWSKSSASAPTELLDASGQPIKLNRGNTWYEAIPTGNSVTY